MGHEYMNTHALNQGMSIDDPLVTSHASTIRATILKSSTVQNDDFLGEST